MEGCAGGIAANSAHVSSARLLVLVNLENDEGELNDLGQEAPEILRRMRTRLESQPSRNEVVFDMNQPWDTFGGEETREPWAEVTVYPPEK